VYEEFSREFPEIAATFERLASMTHEVGPLDQRTRRLVKLGMAIGADSPSGVPSQVRKALDEGISRKEIEHAILLGMTTLGLPQIIAARQWARPLLDEIEANAASIARSNVKSTTAARNRPNACGGELV
jgi:alkylhydroperoxidase/carboxymuconolactone decarboxylase family protein YurZ